MARGEQKGAGVLLDNVSVARVGRGRAVVQGLSHFAPAGSVTVICGPNGSGKSTLFAGLVGERAGLSFAGTVEVHQGEGPPRPLSPADVAYLPQTQAYVGGDRVETFLGFNARSSLETDTAMRRMVQHFGVQDLMTCPLRELSGGQWKRVQCASHFGGIPGVLRVLDEPESGLDGEGLGQLVSALAASRAQGSVILLASHSRNFVRAVADHVLYLEGGQVRWQSSRDLFFRLGPFENLAY